MHTVSRKRRTMAVLAVVVLVAVAGAGMAYGANVWQHYRLDLPRGYGTDYVDRAMSKRFANQAAEDKNTSIEPGYLGSNLVRTRIVQNNTARAQATLNGFIRSGQDVHLRYNPGQGVAGRSFLLAQNVVPGRGCPLFVVTTTGRWSPDNFFWPHPIP